MSGTPRFLPRRFCYNVRHMNDVGLWSVVPPLVAIVLALVTREIVLSLIAAIISGTAIHVALSGGNVLGVFRLCLDLIGSKMAANMPLVIFLCLLGALVSVVTRAGGARAYGDRAFRKLKSERSANLMTIVMGLIIFIDDYFNCLTVGTVMRPVTDRFKISRAKLAYFIDTTAAPVCILAPVSSWAAYVISCLPEPMRDKGLAMYIGAAGFNFYAILSLVMVLWIALKPGHDFGLMKRMETTSHRHHDVGAEVIMREGLEQIPVSDCGSIVDLVAPIVVLIVSSACLLRYYDAGEALALSAFLSLVATFLFLVPRRVIDYHQFAAAVLFGIKTMVPALVLLALAWGISAVCTDLLGTGRFIASAIVKGGVPVGLLPAALFVIAAIFAFTTGASWGAIGILVPIGMAVVTATNPAMATLVLAATLAGSVMGDHCSPISDTTILSSAGAQCKHMNHVMTQIPYALVAGLLSLILYLVLGFAF